MKTTSSTTKSSAPPRQQQKLMSAVAARAMRDELRDAACVGPRYPGKPDDYRYSFRETCTPVLPSSKAKKAKKATPSQASQQESARKEAQALRKELARYPNGEPEAERKRAARMPPFVVWTMFASMIAPHYRAKFPDPKVRFMNLLDKYPKNGTPPNIPYRIFMLLLTHLEALLSDENDDVLPGNGAVYKISKKKPKPTL
jgi:hypothetical protein